jgi:hypothetical protein
MFLSSDEGVEDIYSTGSVRSGPVIEATVPEMLGSLEYRTMNNTVPEMLGSLEYRTMNNTVPELLGSLEYRTMDEVQTPVILTDFCNSSDSSHVEKAFKE